MGNNRAEFSAKTKEQLAKTVGYLCSKPDCNEKTIGPKGNEGETQNLGEAAHIHAASKNGPRYNADMSDDERKSFSNGIWLCKKHAREIDVNIEKFTVGLLQEWKEKAILKAKIRIENPNLALEEYTQREKKILLKINGVLEDSNSKYMLKEHPYESDFQQEHLNLIFELYNYLVENINRIQNIDLKTVINNFIEILSEFCDIIVFSGGPSMRIHGAHDIEVEEIQKDANKAAQKVWEFYDQTLIEYIDKIE